MGEEEALVWESTTPWFIRFVSDRRYRLFSAKVQQWYKPICPNCGPAMLATLRSPKI
jgi:hypothetical protein